MLALTASVFADGDTVSPLAADEGLVAGQMGSDCKPKPKECKPKPKECKPKPKPCEPCVIPVVCPTVLTTARPCYDAGVYIFADALYWFADVGNNGQFVVVNPIGTPVAGNTVQTNFKWDWGFRVGIGFDSDHDQWDTDFYYTWFRDKNSTSSSGDGDGDADDLSSGNKGKLHYNVADWELGRWFYISQSVSLRPHVGIKGSWIKLNQTASLTSAGVPFVASESTKFWSVGPSAGVNTNWWFGDVNNHHFGIFGDFGSALMFARFKTNYTATGVTSVSSNKQNRLVPMMSGFMGLEYDTCFSCNKMHLGIRLGYELQYWFKQAEVLSNNIGLQGATLDFRLDF
jgi:hypothetical protein